MRLQWKLHPNGYVQDSELSFDLMVEQALDVFRHDSLSLMDLLMLYESMKQQIVELTENGLNSVHRLSRSSSVDKLELLLIEQELLTAEELAGELRSILLLLLSMIHYRVGNLSNAKYLALIARSELNQYEIETHLGFADFLLALCSMGLTEWEEAHDRCVLALHEISLEQSPILVAQVWHIFAQVLYKSNKLEESFAALVMARELFAGQGLVVKQIQVALTMSLVLASHEDWYGGIYHLKAALPLCHMAGLHSLELEVLHMLVYFFQKTGQQNELEGCKLRISRLMGEL